jgi:predicted nucleic acid-binding protein
VNVLVDTSVWSLALRRNPAPRHRAVDELGELIREGRALMLGLVRQELLSGVRTVQQFESLKGHLRGFPDIPLATEDHEEAASFFNTCRSHGIQGSSIDLLICAVAARRRSAILTTDEDFSRYARLLPIQLHQLRSAKG